MTLDTALDSVDQVAATLGTGIGPALANLIDTDELYWDAAVTTLDGTELSSAQAQLFRSYFGLLGRTPDDAGYAWWLNEIDSGRHDLRLMAAGFLFSEEFLTRADINGDNVLSHGEFLEHMYRNVLGRSPDPDGFAWWLDQLESGTRTQTNVAVDMTQSNEYVELTLYVTVDYLVN